jgi:heterotetrameric sarcosine oxidase gamma subunit
MPIESSPARTGVTRLDPCALIAVEIWSDHAACRDRLGAALSGTVPAFGGASDLPGGWRMVSVEPTVWWLRGPLGDLETGLARVEAALSADGAATDLTGGFARLGLHGPDWREILMSGGVFDAEDPGFGSGRTAGTILHHASGRIDVTGDSAAELYVIPSQAADLLDLLRSAAADCG